MKRSTTSTTITRRRAPKAKSGKPAKLKAVKPKREPIEKPNAEHPLAESSLNRRVWAAYLHRGMNRAQFARAMGVNYFTVDRWDKGEVQTSLDMLQRASTVLRFTMDELCFGSSAQAADPVLNEAGIRQALTDLHVDQATRIAFSEHAFGPTGRSQTITRAYVAGWCASHRSGLTRFMNTADADTLALQAGVQSRALAGAVAAGARALSVDDLRDAFAKLLADLGR